MLSGLCVQPVLILYIQFWLIFHKEKGQEFIGRGRYMKHTKTLLIIFRAERKHSLSGQTVPVSMKWGDNVNQTCASEFIYLSVLHIYRTYIFQIVLSYKKKKVQRHSTHTDGCLMMNAK